MTSDIKNSDIRTLVEQAVAAAKTAASSKALQDVKVAYLGKSGSLSGHEYFRSIKDASPEGKKEIGADRTAATRIVTEAIEAKEAELAIAELNAKLASETMDVSLPPLPATTGTIHPITQVIEELTAIFADFGFSVAEGPEVEDDFHNFTALNIPESHPARQMHDTFYLQGNGGEHPVLRTHTSPVQIRTMVNEKPPIRIIAPGSTYRSDSDMTHTPMFHQIEGLVIDKGIHMGHLKGLLHDVLAAFFGLEKVPMQFRPSFFPFTEPSAEVDIGCKRGKDALVIGEGNDWLEILGCGMVHPNVLKNCGLDPAEWQGFAFGFGIERLAMLKYNIPDLRTFFAGDMRWLKHYGFKPLDIPSLVKGVVA
ncbi:MAG: phenylalanine--tRNA ligase subunit alpha [Alphaproteobacteria bacterium]|nr:phenylalanine--tRNA ligase subunit alpha [Alphaproteobacteria bacterium]